MLESKGPLPLLIGITGHLDPEPSDIPEIERKLKEEFKRLAEVWPHTPLKLLTGLARGCDTIAARVALEEKIDLIAVLPMGEEEYLKDFHSHEEKEEFKFLLKKAKEAPTTPPDQDKPINREACYLETGLFIAARSQILLALHNGMESNKPAGTREVIRLKEEGAPPHLWRGGARDLLPGTGEVRVLNVRRQSCPQPPVKMTWTSRESEANRNRMYLGKEYLGKKLTAGALLEAFNERACRKRDRKFYFLDTILEAINSVISTKKAKSSWPGPTLLEGLDLPVDKSGIRDIALAQVYADRLANQYRVRIDYSIWFFFVLIFLSTTLLDLAENIDPFFRPLQLSGLAILGVIGGFWCLWKKNAWMDKEIDFRMIAEGLRVALYWRLAGVRELVADNYPADPRGELDWVRRAIAALEVTVEPLEKPRKDFVVREWLKCQEAYMTEKVYGCSKSGNEKKRSYIGFRVWIQRLRISFGLIFSLILLCQVIKLWSGPFGININNHLNEASSFSHLAVIISLVAALRLSAFLALGIALYQVFGLEQLIRLYHRASMVFEAGARTANKADDEDFRKICLEVGKQSLAENIEWAKIRRDRPLPEPNL